MFEVVVLRDQIPIPYHHMKFGPDKLMTVEPQVLCDLIAHRYNDRVQPRLGLLIDVYDIVRAYECKSLPDISVAYATVVFRYIVFNPPVGSVWEGLVHHATKQGVYLQLSFFKDIFVPLANLPDGCEWDDAQNTLAFANMDEEGGDPTPFAFYLGQVARFRVCEVNYQSVPGEPPMIVIGSMDSRTSGLGMKAWWRE